MKEQLKKAGLFFGSFNPVHVGHLAIANYMLSFTELDEVWFVLSPQSPHKRKKGLLDPWLRLEMLHLAVNDYPGFRVTDIELFLPQPSYTVVTLEHLREKHPCHSFSLIMGSDNLVSIVKWFNYRVIVDNYPIYVYPRPGYEAVSTPMGAKVVYTTAPLMEISSSFIRKGIKEGKELKFFLPEKVYEYIVREQIYH